MLTRIVAALGLKWSSGCRCIRSLVAAFPALFLFAENAEQQVTLAPLWAPLAAVPGRVASAPCWC